jgi:thiamine biosynthesis lipoprotein ApbE
MSTINNQAPAMTKPTIALIHHVFFWLNHPDSEADKNALITGLNSLRAIPSIQRMHVGVLASTEKREVVDTSWDVSEIMFFNDAAGQKVYQDHPIHMEFVKNCAHLWKKVLVYDAQDV